jgi:cellulose synthase/poly-beta-1,6-N-acetylglucosamine synthase-like glycosyltransferase
MEVLPGKNFDLLLYNQMFISMQACGHYANAGVGSIAGHWVLKEYLDRVNRNFKGDGDLIYDCGVRMFSDVLWIAQKEKRADKIAFLPVEMFYPYNHETGSVLIAPYTIVYHHYTKSWIPETPKITFVIPTLGREEGLKRCVDSINNLNYSKDKIEIIVKHDSYENRTGVPKLLKQGVEESTGEWVVFASNDCEFTPDCIREALIVGKDGYVAFNTGPMYPDEGNANEHFMIRKDIIAKIGEVFDTDFWHTGCDNLLWAKMKKLGIAKRAEKAILNHYHWTKTSDRTMDKTYSIGWSHVDEDRALLKKKLAEL